MNEYLVIGNHSRHFRASDGKKLSGYSKRETVEELMVHIKKRKEKGVYNYSSLGVTDLIVLLPLEVLLCLDQ